MNATIGKYVPGNTIAHRTNPVVKLINNLLFIVLIFLSKSFILMGVLLIIALGTYLIAGLRFKQLFNILLTTLLIGTFLFIANMFLVKDGYGSITSSDGGQRVDYNDTSPGGFFFSPIKFLGAKITDRGVFQTFFIMLRIYIMIILTTILTATTKPTALTKAIETLLFPLKLLFIPVHIIAMIISIALRFIPTLLEEAQRIMKAQASRGVDFKNGNLKTKAKSMITLIIPLFVSAFAKAEDLGNAMETRGYDPYEKRTKYRVYPLTLKDLVIAISVIGLFVLIILSKENVIPNPSWWV